MKKTATIVAIGVVLAAAAFAGFWYFRGSINQNGEPTPPPPQVENSLVSLSEKLVTRYWEGGGVVYIASGDGRLSKVSGGTETVISDQLIPEFRSAVESPDGKRLLASFGPSRTPTFSIFDIGAGKWSPLPAGTTAAAWSPSGTEVVYLADGASGSSVSTMNVATLKKTELVRLAGNDFSLSWVTPKKIYLVDKPSAQYPVSSWSLDVAARTLVPLMDPANGLSVRWNQPGSAAFVFTNSFKENRLALTAGTGNLIALAPFVTLPEKCTFSSNPSPVSVYCAVPSVVPPGTLLPDEFLTESVRFSDDVVAWTPGTAPVTIYAHGSVPVDAVELTVSSDGKKIRFVNRYDKKLYEISVGD